MPQILHSSKGILVESQQTGSITKSREDMITPGGDLDDASSE
jgi:hypothetical protein